MARTRRPEPFIHPDPTKAICLYSKWYGGQDHEYQIERETPKFYFVRKRIEDEQGVVRIDPAEERVPKADAILFNQEGVRDLIERFRRKVQEKQQEIDDSDEDLKYQIDRVTKDVKDDVERDKKLLSEYQQKLTFFEQRLAELVADDEINDEEDDHEEHETPLESANWEKDGF